MRIDLRRGSERNTVLGPWVRVFSGGEDITNTCFMVDTETKQVGVFGLKDGKKYIHPDTGRPARTILDVPDVLLELKDEAPAQIRALFEKMSQRAE
jgi:hypothetical protein